MTRETRLRSMARTIERHSLSRRRVVRLQFGSSWFAARSVPGRPCRILGRSVETQLGEVGADQQHGDREIR